MKKIFKTLTVIILTLLMKVGLANASNLNVTGNTSESAEITDTKGNTITKNEKFSEWQPVDVTYPDITIENKDISNGDTISIIIPENVQVKQNIKAPVLAKDKQNIGTFTILKGAKMGTITITNAKHVNSTPLNRHLYVSFGAYGTVKDENTNDDWIINKVAWINQTNGNIVWNVAVNNQDGLENTIIIKDTPDDNQSLINNTVNVQYGHYQGQTFIVERQGTLPMIKTKDGFEVDLGRYSEKNAQITYETKPLTNGFIKNDVMLKVNGKEIGSNSATVNYGADAGYIGSSNQSKSSLNNSSSSDSSLSSSSMSSSSSDEITSKSSVSSDLSNDKTALKSNSSSEKLLNDSSSSIKDERTKVESTSISKSSVTGSSNNNQQKIIAVKNQSKNLSSTSSKKHLEPSNQNNEIPKTGEKQEYLKAIGVVILTLLFLFIIVLRKKDKK